MKIQNITYKIQSNNINNEYRKYSRLETSESQDTVTISFKGEKEELCEKDAKKKMHNSLVEEKLLETNYNFCSGDRETIADVVWNRGTMPVLDKILERDEVGNLRFHRSQILSLVFALKLKDLPVLEAVMSSKDENGKNLYSARMIDEVLSSKGYKMIRKESLSLNEMMDKTFSELEERRNHFEMVSEKLTQAGLRVSVDEQEHIEGFLWQNNAISLIDKLLEKAEDGKMRFGKGQIQWMVRFLKQEDLPALEQLMSAKNKNGQYLYCAETISDVITSPEYSRVKELGLSQEEISNKVLMLAEKERSFFKSVLYKIFGL